MFLDVDDVLGLFNLGSLGLFVVLAALAGARMAWRLWAFLSTSTSVPVLLRRDLVLLTSFAVYLGTALLALVLEWTNLRTEPLWVVPRAVLVLGAMGYWVWVEYRLDDPSSGFGSGGTGGEGAHGGPGGTGGSAPG
jgi:hypothetical protein